MLQHPRNELRVWQYEADNTERKVERFGLHPPGILAEDGTNVRFLYAAGPKSPAPAFEYAQEARSYQSQNVLS